MVCMHPGRNSANLTKRKKNWRRRRLTLDGGVGSGLFGLLWETKMKLFWEVVAECVVEGCVVWDYL